MTRTELLEARGYPPEIIAGSNGNGHSPAPEIEAVPTRTCRGCPTPIDGSPSRVWCSESCRRAARNSAGTRRQTPATPHVEAGAISHALPAIDGFRPIAYLLEAGGQLLPILTRSASNNERTT